MVAALLLPDRTEVSYVAEQILLTLDGFELARPFAWMHMVSWGIHIAASASDVGRFERIRDFANSRGGMPTPVLYAPPIFVAAEEDDEWQQLVHLPALYVPDLSTFLVEKKTRLAHKPADAAIDLAISLLAATDFSWFDSSALLRSLCEAD